MKEAEKRQTDTGEVVEGGGWFVRNLADASWERDATHGVYCRLEPEDVRFEHFTANVHIVEPGQANGLYHAESDQEGFLVLSGECTLIVEGEERPLRQWDYFHCPPGCNHILVGAGDGPCAILMLGALGRGDIHYPVDPVAAKHGASALEPTDVPAEAYSHLDRTRSRERAPWPPEG